MQALIEWRDSWQAGRTDVQTDRQTDRQTDGWQAGRTDVQTVSQNGETDGLLTRQADQRRDILVSYRNDDGTKVETWTGVLSCVPPTWLHRSARLHAQQFGELGPRLDGLTTLKCHSRFYAWISECRLRKHISFVCLNSTNKRRSIVCEVSTGRHFRIYGRLEFDLC
jgi:hypothetical protein